MMMVMMIIMILPLDLLLNDLIFLGTTIFVVRSATAENVDVIITRGTIEACVPFTRTVNVPRAIFWAQNGWNKWQCLSLIRWTLNKIQTNKQHARQPKIYRVSRNKCSCRCREELNEYMSGAHGIFNVKKLVNQVFLIIYMFCFCNQIFLGNQSFTKQEKIFPWYLWVFYTSVALIYFAMKCYNFDISRYSIYKCITGQGNNSIYAFMFYNILILNF